MHDPFGRDIRSLRVSVTRRCDLRCFYCHGEGQGSSDEEMSPAELERLVDVASSLGVRKVKLTGGEPLMRDDISEIVSRMAPRVDEVSMTTNGVLLGRMASELKRSGLKRVNVSLDTLDAGTFRRVSGLDALHLVKNGITEAASCGLGVKLNAVMLRGVNEGELDALMEFAAGQGAALQLIELTAARCRLGDWPHSEFHCDLGALEERFGAVATGTALNELHNRRRYRVPLALPQGGTGTCEVELVRPMHNTRFCANCTRLRLTSDGKLKPCLLSDGGLVDVLGVLRRGGSDDELRSRFKEAVGNRRPYWSEEGATSEEGPSRLLSPAGAARTSRIPKAGQRPHGGGG